MLKALLCGGAVFFLLAAVTLGASVSKLSCGAGGTRFILPWAATGQVAALYKLRIVHHPKASEVIFVAHEALVQGQVGANCVLQREQTKGATGKERGKEGKISVSL